MIEFRKGIVDFADCLFVLEDNVDEESKSDYFDGHEIKNEFRNANHLFSDGGRLKDLIMNLSHCKISILVD